MELLNKSYDFTLDHGFTFAEFGKRAHGLWRTLVDVARVFPLDLRQQSSRDLLVLLWYHVVDEAVRHVRVKKKIGNYLRLVWDGFFVALSDYGDEELAVFWVDRRLE